MKPEALSHLTRLANDFAFISFMAWLRRILIVISLIGVATDLYRISAESKGCKPRGFTDLTRPWAIPPAYRQAARGFWMRKNETNRYCF